MTNAHLTPPAQSANAELGSFETQLAETYAFVGDVLARYLKSTAERLADDLKSDKAPQLRREISATIVTLKRILDSSRPAKEAKTKAPSAADWSQRIREARAAAEARYDKRLAELRLARQSASHSNSAASPNKPAVGPEPAPAAAPAETGEGPAPQPADAPRNPLDDFPGEEIPDPVPETWWIPGHSRNRWLLAKWAQRERS